MRTDSPDFTISSNGTDSMGESNVEPISASLRQDSFVAWGARIWNCRSSKTKGKERRPYDKSTCRIVLSAAANSETKVDQSFFNHMEGSKIGFADRARFR